MANREFHYYLNQFPLRPDSRRWWPKAIIVCATLGGLYGAAMGAAVGAVPGAGDVIEMAAAVFALICGVPGARLWFSACCFPSISFRSMASRAVCHNWRRDPGRIPGDRDPAGVWSDRGCPGRLALHAGHSSTVFLEENRWRNRGRRGGIVYWSGPLGNKSQSTCSPCRRGMGLGNWGGRRPVTATDGHGDLECATSRQRECRRCDLSRRRPGQTSPVTSTARMSSF